MHLRKLSRSLEIPLSALTYHLTIMRKCGLVREFRSGHHREFYVTRAQLPGPGDNQSEWGPVILERLRESGPMTAPQIAKALGISRQAAHYHLERLCGLRCVTSDQRRRNRHYALLVGGAHRADDGEAFTLLPARALPSRPWKARAEPAQSPEATAPPVEVVEQAR